MKRQLWFAVLLGTLTIELTAQTPRSRLWIPEVVDELEVWPAAKPFTVTNVRSWAVLALERRKNEPYKLLRITVGPDSNELRATAGGRLGHDDFGDYLGESRKRWPTHPIAQVISLGGKAAVQIQMGDGGFAIEEALGSSGSPFVFEIKGRLFRLLHFKVEDKHDHGALAVFFQSEKREIEPSDAADLVRILSRTVNAGEIRMVVRPDAWIVDVSYPWFYRFVMNFGSSYYLKPDPITPRGYFRSSEITCERDLAGAIRCDRVSVGYETFQYRE